MLSKRVNWKHDFNTFKLVDGFVNELIPKRLSRDQTKKLYEHIQNTPIHNNMSKLDFVTYSAMTFYNHLVGGKIPANLEVDIRETLFDIINQESTGLNKADNIALHTHRNVNTVLNPRPLNKKVANDVINFFSSNTIIKLARALNPKATKKKVYLILDLKYAEFLDDNTRLRWDITQTLQKPSDTKYNITNTKKPIRNITELRVHSYTMYKNALTSGYNRANLYIEEFRSQSFLNPDGSRYHTTGFLSDVEDPVPLLSRNAVTLASNPDFATRYNYEVLSGYRFNDGKYKFDKPITELSTITMSIYDPFSKINVPKCFYKNVNIESYTTNSDLPFTFTLEFNEPHYLVDTFIDIGLSAGPYSLKISNFITSDPVSDALLIKFINNNEFTNLTISDSTSIEVDALRVSPAFGDSSPEFILGATLGAGDTYELTGTPESFNVSITSIRTFFTIELTCDKDSDDINNFAKSII